MIQWLKDQAEEFLIGFLIGLGFFPVLKLGAVVLGLVTGVLHRLGGCVWKPIRRFGVPLVIALFMHRISWWIGGAFVLSVILLSLGYGTKTVYSDDPGSPFGNWCVSVAGERLGKWLARGIIIVSIWLVWGGAYGLQMVFKG